MVSRLKFSHQIIALCSIALASSISACSEFSDDDLLEIQTFQNAPISLAKAISAAEEEAGGKAMSAEFEVEHGDGVYTVEVVKVDGSKVKILELEVDSQTATVLHIED